MQVQAAAVDKVAEVVHDAIMSSDGDSVSIADVLPRLLSLGATQDDVDSAIEEYVGLGVWTLNPTGTVITINHIDVDDDQAAA